MARTDALEAARLAFCMPLSCLACNRLFASWRHTSFLASGTPERQVSTAALRAEWEDKDAFEKHIKSDYVKKFAEYIEEVTVHSLTALP